ncbi:(Uracil-5)-methyltransferase [Beutenbergia cavernae DSM 12333]|uniref:(Uracil-5)-methyltransferase n=1 Tax=Beutenbergia cavernae (strain ATCC BAA-8 / DSM 12333 / CCUG 43141 / JCM 11478 / NBRC 16432 / NCIMB 13614 / HKI 0122) TaxID=471853 RepID=C5C5K8_BEUC1|nr:TRAM domain-containing protein [Beutenbergia cavernae]ACQ80199.1 (Uracil-5)-methyltransferase [Beutenbergia cavernae DSM 12333]
MAELIRLTIGPPAHGGHAVARIDDRPDGRVVFVRHAIPGEVVLARVTDGGESARFWRADAVRILEPSPDRVPSVWPEAGPDGVGGGELAHVALPAQLRWKEEVLRDALRRIGHLEADVTVRAAPGDAESGGLGTRTRVELTVAPDGRPGMHRHRSHVVLPLNDVPLAVDALREHDALRRRWEPGSRLDLVAGSEGAPLVLLDGAPVRGDRRTVRERVELGDGRAWRYRVAGSGFWQVHRAAPTVLVEAVLDAAQPQAGERVLDLYSGAGLFTLPLADAVGADGQVAAVEGDPAAVRDARRNLHDRGQVDLHGGSVADVLDAGVGAGADLVILDPPRAGAGRDVVEAVTGRRPRRIVYVACDPAALARDLRLAADAGYALTSLDAVDLFPHTHHIEALAVLEPAAR